MDADRQRVQDDLRGLIQGDVFCDPIRVQMYSIDASIYSIPPLGVVRPAGKQDVQACVRYAAENRIPIHARGSATGLAGGCLGPGLVMDFSRSMRLVLGAGSDWVRVQPGVLLSKLNRYLAEYGRRFGPDPSTVDLSTVGGTVSVNGSGSHFPRYGAPCDCVEAMEIVLADGTLMRCTRLAEEEEPSAIDGTIASRPQEVRQRLGQILNQHRDTIEAARPKTDVNSSGYELRELAGGAIDMPRLLTGSEGTLGLMTEITVKTFPLPRATGVVLLFFDRLEKAARAALELRSYPVSACDLIDRRLLKLARESDSRFEGVVPGDAEAMLLVEMEGASRGDVHDRLRALTNHILRKKALAYDARSAIDATDVELFWSVAQHVVPRLYRISGSIRPVPFVEDIAIPPLDLPEFLTKTQNILKRHQITASFFAHAVHGQLHIRPFMNLDAPEEVARLHHLARDLYREVADVGGTLSGEHGDGLCRSWFLREQNPAFYEVLREVKTAFDPHSLLNPGKVADEVPASPTASLRKSESWLREQERLQTRDEAPRGLPASPAKLEFGWSRDELFQIVSTCNGCGRCRTMEQEQRMCPIFRIAPHEEASPRAKATILRGLFDGTIDQASLGSDTLREISNLCINCRQCKTECPAGVDIPGLVLECKAQHVAMNGLAFSDWWLGRLDVVAAWIRRFRFIVQPILRSRRFRWLLARTMGLAPQRKLPKLARTPFLSKAAREQFTKHVRGTNLKVVYFVDIYANWFDTDLADATIQVMKHNGVSVYVPPKQRQSGMTLIAAGGLVKARRFAEHNVRLLSDAVRQGYQIITSEPTAALCLTQEYPRLLPGENARVVADNTFDACAYLWQMHQRGNLALDFKPLTATIAYHEPCHLRALGHGPVGVNLLRLIPGVTVRHVEKGCSGMAGTWGLKAANYRKSLKAGWPLIQEMRRGPFDVGATECSTCKLQMEQGITSTIVHPLKILAYAYGMMPTLEPLLRQQNRELLVS